MEIVAFILIACIWAAFLLPSFFESRRKAPLNTTRSFARSTALLASVATSTGPEIIARRKAHERRQRFLTALAGAAIISLGVAILRSSVLWLGVTLICDLTIAAYIGVMLDMRQQAETPRVVALPSENTLLEPDRHTVRVVAG
jgi:hypothetical protein